MVQTYRADGLIQLGERPLNELLPNEEHAQIPFVQAISADPRGAYPTVGIDDRSSSAMMARHLIAQGHRRIGVIAGLQNRLVTQERLKGIKDAIADAGLDFDDTIVEYAPYSMGGGEQAAQRLLSRARHLTALFCMSDEIAIGAI